MTEDKSQSSDHEQRIVNLEENRFVTREEFEAWKDKVRDIRAVAYGQVALLFLVLFTAWWSSRGSL